MHQHLDLEGREILNFVEHDVAEAQRVALASLERAHAKLPCAQQDAVVGFCGIAFTDDGEVGDARVGTRGQVVVGRAVVELETLVGIIAGLHGFKSPNHFARDYRLMFGELPRKTLQRARAA